MSFDPLSKKELSECIESWQEWFDAMEPLVKLMDMRDVPRPMAYLLLQLNQMAAYFHAATHPEDDDDDWRQS